MRGVVFLGLIGAAALASMGRKKKAADSGGGSSSGAEAPADGDSDVEADVDDILGGDSDDTGTSGAADAGGEGLPGPDDGRSGPALDDVSPGGFGRLPPYSPPQTPRSTPSKPGRKIKMARPEGTRIIPQVVVPSEDCSLPGGTFTVIYEDEDLSDHIYREGKNADAFARGKNPPFESFGLDELAHWTLQVYLPKLPNDKINRAYDVIERWACILGYKGVVFVDESPDSAAFTARAWHRGDIIGEYNLEVTFTKPYLDAAVQSGELVEFFLYGLVDWLHGAG